MKSDQRLLIFLCAALMTLTAPAAIRAQSRLDADSLRFWGGSYSTACANSTAPRLQVFADALTVDQGNKRLTGSNVQAAHSFFGQSPPDNYRVALTSEVRGKYQMLFIVFEDRTGMYITLDGDREVQNALGKALFGRKFYRCGGERQAERQAATPPPPAAPASGSSAEPVVNPWDLLSDAKFKKAYYAALGLRASEPWLAKLDGPASPTKKIRADGLEYVMAVSCKNHDCEDNNLLLLYSPSQGKVYGKVLDRRRAFLIGEPPSGVAAELDRLWTAEWRQKR